MGRRVGAAAAVALVFVACSSTTNIANLFEGDGGDAGQPVGLAPADGGGDTTADAGVDQHVPEDGGVDSGADAADGGVTDSGDASAPVDGGGDSGVDAGACNGFVRYEIPVNSYAWGHKCSGFKLDSTVSDPPTQTQCQFEGTTLVEQCVKLGPFAATRVIYFKQTASADCDIQMFPQLDGGDTHTCP